MEKILSEARMAITEGGVTYKLYLLRIRKNKPINLRKLTIKQAIQQKLKKLTFLALLFMLNGLTIKKNQNENRYRFSI